MNVLYRIVVLVLCIYGSYCVKYDPREEQLHCIRSCRDSQKRSCLQPPGICGNCLLPYEEDTNGLCEARRDTEFVVKPAKKGDTGAINLAANQSSDSVHQEQQATLALTNDILFIAVIACVSAAAVIGIIIAVVCLCKAKKSAKGASEYEYPAYGSMDYKGGDTVTKSTGDRRLAQSAQMYHYQHQKQQMLELEKNQNTISKSGSDTGSDDDNDASEYTVYECPGLAVPGEIEVQNPLFVEQPQNALYPEIPQNVPERNDGAHVVNGYEEKH